jgi:hypothetical protein
LDFFLKEGRIIWEGYRKIQKIEDQKMTTEKNSENTKKFRKMKKIPEKF